MERYFYFIWATIFFILWLCVFLMRKDTRREMLVISGIFGIGGILADQTNTQDWWHPLTITGTRVGFEAFLIGFSIAGIAAVIYELVYRKRLKNIRRAVSAPSHPIFFILSFALVYLSLFYILRIGSFYSVVLTYSCFALYMIIMRRDLILDSFASGILMLLVGSSLYWFLFLLYPTYVKDFWYLGQHWWTNLFLGIPIEEYLWFFLTGSYIGPLYEYVSGMRLSEMK